MSMPWDSALGLWGKAMDNNYEVGTKTTTKKNLSQEAINKLIYDALSSDQGLAALASGENLAGGSKSASKTLLAQDMMAKIVGELAAVTAETEQMTDEVKTTKEGRAVNKIGDAGDKYNAFNRGQNLDDTVICTELHRQGKLSSELYHSVGAPYAQVSYFTWRGYHLWASRVVPLMARSDLLSNLLLPIIRSRYLLLSDAPGFHFLGHLTCKIGEPICWMIGTAVAHFAHFKELKYGRDD